MKRAIIILIFCLSFYTIKECLGLFYIRMTHLTQNDLKWTDTCSHNKTTFTSNLGNKSYLINTERIVDNSYNPFFISSAPGFWAVYEANSWLNFKIIGNTHRLDGYIAVSRQIGTNELSMKAGLGANFTEDYTEIKTTSIKFRNHTVRDCILFNCNNTIIHPYHIDSLSLHVDKFILSKSLGLVYYKLANGEEFTRNFKPM